MIITINTSFVNNNETNYAFLPTGYNASSELVEAIYGRNYSSGAQESIHAELADGVPARCLQRLNIGEYSNKDAMLQFQQCSDGWRYGNKLDAINAKLDTIGNNIPPLGEKDAHDLASIYGSLALGVVASATLLCGASTFIYNKCQAAKRNLLESDKSALEDLRQEQEDLRGRLGEVMNDLFDDTYLSDTDKENIRIALSSNQTENLFISNRYSSEVVQGKLMKIKDLFEDIYNNEKEIIKLQNKIKTTKIGKKYEESESFERQLRKDQYKKLATQMEKAFTKMTSKPEASVHHVIDIEDASPQHQLSRLIHTDEDPSFIRNQSDRKSLLVKQIYTQQESSIGQVGFENQGGAVLFGTGNNGRSSNITPVQQYESPRRPSQASASLKRASQEFDSSRLV